MENMEVIQEKKNNYKSIGWLIIILSVVSIFYFEIYKVWKGENSLTTQSAFLLMLICLIVGEIISIKTKAFVPSMFVSAILFVLGFWTFFPKNILQLGGVAPNLPTFLVMLMVVHLGTMLNIQELINQWRTVLVTLGGMLGILIAILTVGSLILGVDTAAIAAPPLTGGFVAALMMQGAAGDNQHLFILAMAVYVLQGFIGYPLTSLCLKKEGKDLIKKYREGTLKLDNDSTSNSKNKNIKKYKWDLFEKIPTKYQSDFTNIFTMVVLVVLSGYLEIISAGYISKFVWALILGVFAAALGFIEPQILIKSRSMGFVYTIIMMFVFSQLNSITPETLVLLLKDFAILIVLATLGIAIVSIPLGRFLGWSTAMSFAIGLGSLAGGFPASYVLSVEAAKVVSETEEEYKIVEENILPKTLVSGFVSATSGSVFIAGAVLAFFFK
ncbi:hypothetical protein [Cetobacterium sp. 2A]|uniref:hypothetical protein n=1 Tax=Cetobacterium sp. 2A TaxID=2754723 RepID=UPI001C8E0A57|nr:hypothetical protein [Cetobacterium sp. 2A]